MRQIVLPLLLLLTACGGPVTDRVKTTFQTTQGWRPTLDNRADAVMVYGVESPERLQERLQSWQDRGYETHFMTGIAWGNYQDYFTGEWDGRYHLDEGQVEASGDTLWHGKMVPYIVPTENYLQYFKEQHIKPVIDAGVNHIFLEEPEFWARAGYSDAFKREWEAFYGTPWRPQDESPEATYLSQKLKYHLYYRALDEAFTYAKEYGRSLGREIKCYVPTHSLINYTKWQIVSPEASLASLESVDGYIAQVWTGTSRSPVYYRGLLKERVFESAYLEYGCMASMTGPTGRELWFLTDPIEDASRDWEDYRRNYQATFTAQLLYPQVARYEIMPWPERIYERLYPVSPGSEQKSRIPKDFASMMQVMLQALQQMPAGEKVPSRYSVLMANSLMFQAFPAHEGYEDPELSNFFGLALPLLKRGIPVGITHLENLSYPEALDGVEVLSMTYSNMKPLSPDAHQYLADWVKGGGKLLYSATDQDPFQSVQEWWNTGENSFSAPSAHLFSLLGLSPEASAGTYACGKGTVCVLRQDPKEFVLKEESPYIEALEGLSGPLSKGSVLRVERGPYRIVAVLDEGEWARPQVEEGCLIDLYDPALPVYEKAELQPAQQGLFYDVAKAGKAPQILAAASRAYEEKRTNNAFTYMCKGPADTWNVTRILLPKEPKTVLVNGEACPADWDARSETCLLRFPNSPDGVQVNITW